MKPFSLTLRARVEQDEEHEKGAEVVDTSSYYYGNLPPYYA